MNMSLISVWLNFSERVFLDSAALSSFINMTQNTVVWADWRGHCWVTVNTAAGPGLPTLAKLLTN